jgi:hypothetical protein
LFTGSLPLSHTLKMPGRNMQKRNKKPDKEKRKNQEHDNPFDDIFFWLTLATTET